jgi:hypothetical protein
MSEERAPDLLVNDRANTLYGEALEPEAGTMPEPTDEKAEEATVDSLPPSDDAEEATVDSLPPSEDDEPVPGNEDLDDELPTPAEPDTEEVEVQTLSQLAEHLETDPDWLMKLKTKAKVRGEEVEFSIADAIEVYQKVESADSYLREAKEKGAAHAESIAKREEQVSNSVVEMTALLSLMETSLNQDINSEDMRKLREQDPAEYAARKADHDERKKGLENLKVAARERYTQTLQAINEEREKARKEALPDEQKALLSRVPEWKDTEKAEKEVTQVLEWLSKDGFSNEDIKTASWNGRLMAMATKAYRYDMAKGKTQAAKKKITTIPKILKPGSQKSAKSNTTSGKKTDRVEILYG